MASLSTSAPDSACEARRPAPRRAGQADDVGRDDPVSLEVEWVRIYKAPS
jgi:hypothetical protein